MTAQDEHYRADAFPGTAFCTCARLTCRRHGDVDPWARFELADTHDAWLSRCERYRYRLWRPALLGGGSGCVTWLMLNPSTADAKTDDPTIRKCRGFSSRIGAARFRVWRHVW